MSNKKITHYNLENIEKEDASFNLIWGEKGNGKTSPPPIKCKMFSESENILTNFCSTNNIFIFKVLLY